jgi:Ala-tRNA(Pro) deacylase
VCLDRELRTAERISFHPNINTATLVLAFSDFERFLTSQGNPMRYLTV